MTSHSYDSGHGIPAASSHREGLQLVRDGVVEGFDPAPELLQVGKWESLQQADGAPQQIQFRGILDHQHARQHEQITHGCRLRRKGEKRHAVPEPHDVVILRQTRRRLAFALLGRGRDDGVVVECRRDGPRHLRVGGERLHAQHLLEIERCVDKRSELAVECVDLLYGVGSTVGQGLDVQGCHGIAGLSIFKRRPLEQGARGNAGRAGPENSSSVSSLQKSGSIRG